MPHRFSACLVSCALALLLAGCGGGSSSSDDAAGGTGPTPPPDPPAAPSTVDAGSLKLKVDENPWRMHFLDANGQPLLDEHPGTTTTPAGALGFHLGLPPAGDGLLPLLPPVLLDQPQAPIERGFGWMHAMRVLESRYEGQTWIATLATNDPSGRTLTLRAEPQADGVIALTVTPSSDAGIQAMGIGFVAEADERFFGFGERSNAVNQRGRAVEHYVGEGPYQDEEYPGIMAVVPKWGIRWRKDATYFPIPWLLSSRGYGVLLDNDALSYHRLTEAAAWSMEVEEPELRFRVFAGPAPADVLRRYSQALGRQPRNYAPWFFGPWVQHDNDERVRQLREADVPSSLRATYTHYLPCGDQQGREIEEAAMVARANAEGLAVHTYFNPMVCTNYTRAYEQAVSMSALLKNALAQDYVFPYTTDTVFTVSEIDFSAPNAPAYFAGLAAEAMGHGHEGWMEDFGEYAPLDAVAADGATGTRLHNRHARDYHCGVQAGLAAAGVTRPLARFVRSGWTGSAACSPLVWGGDPSTSFGFDGLESSIYQALSMGTSGVGLWGSDIGGFFALGFTSLSPENFDRWIQFGAFSPVMRSQKDGIPIPPGKVRPQPWDPAHLPLWRRYTKLHTQLWPYLQAAVEQYYATGLPLMRHHALTHPGDAQAIARDDQYLFGPDLLVAPVYVEGVTERELYLPAGHWVDAWRSLEYREADGSFHIKAVTLLAGARAVTLPAPRAEIPFLIRAGSVIPLLSPDVYTLAEHSDDPGIVHWSDRADRLRLLAFPRGNTTASFYENETLSSEERVGEWRLSIQGTRERSYQLEAALGALATPFVPCTVTVAGGNLQDWHYDATSRVLTAHLQTQNGTLTARACQP